LGWCQGRGAAHSNGAESKAASQASLPCPASSWPSQLDTADRQEPTEALAAKVRLTEKLTKLKEEMGKLDVYEKQMLASLL
jgi:hypothetical protein